MVILSSANAVDDEPILGPVPTRAELGRQVKRVKTSVLLNDYLDISVTLTDEVIGAQFAKATDMALNLNVNNTLNNTEETVQNGSLVTALESAIDRACGPGGAIENAISRACHPGGAIENLVSTSADDIRRFVASSEQRSTARLYNGSVFNKGASELKPLMGTNHQLPQNFPSTYEDFATMTANVANSLLLSYGLPPGGTIKAKVKRLASHCNVNLPK